MITENAASDMLEKLNRCPKILNISNNRIGKKGVD